MLVAVDTSTAMLKLLEYRIMVSVVSMRRLGSHTTVVLRFDGVPAIMAVLEALHDTDGRPGSIENVVMQTALVHSNQCTGSGERSLQTVRGQMRPLVLQLQWMVAVELHS